jgi:hypothetical protein
MRLVSIEWIILSALLACVSICLKFKIRCLQCQEHLVILLVVRYGQREICVAACVVACSEILQMHAGARKLVD